MSLITRNDHRFNFRNNGRLNRIVNHQVFSIFAAMFLLVFTACENQKSANRMELRNDLLTYHREVTTTSNPAQKYFDQGLALYYGFNHEAAIESFTAGAELDTSCAMFPWAVALASGPDINNMHMDSTESLLAYQSIQKAIQLSPQASDVEKDLIHALATRYVWPAPEDRTDLNHAYARAMAEVYQKYPDDAEVAALYAESLMDLRPWDLWQTDGTPNEGTMEIVTTLENVLSKFPDHPGACHFYIHTMEASPSPEKALAAARVLQTKIPGSGHLVHMPAHIYIRTGDYNNAIISNQNAVAADSSWVAKGGFYTLYMAHNYHFLAYAAMFDGQRKLALDAAHDMVNRIPMEMVREYPDFLDGFMAVTYHVMVRFGMWQELIDEPEPQQDLPVTMAFWHYGRTVAFAASGKVEEAEKELVLLKQAYENVPESRTIGNNSARTVLQVGIPMAEGELEYRRGNYDRAYQLLEQSVARDDELKYDEPWGWMMPVRHSLGALLLEQGHVERAEMVYRKDLEIHPNNGWALHGLAECLSRLDRKKESQEVNTLFAKSWSRSDIRIKASCYCRTAG